MRLLLSFSQAGKTASLVETASLLGLLWSTVCFCKPQRESQASQEQAGPYETQRTQPPTTSLEPLSSSFRDDGAEEEDEYKPPAHHLRSASRPVKHKRASAQDKGAAHPGQQREGNKAQGR
ncbi:hypothetical protein AMECASPLE_012122 [Ameca splendens]|uniref:Uncharacterized protein n=1 Tax=Ameca splendens TaxID=208324 RepID=A0ABV0YZ08_9TELE